MDFAMFFYHRNMDRGQIMLKEQITTVDSSMINKVMFNFQSKTLKVEFTSGALYEYTNVEPEIYDELCKSESQIS